MLDIYDARPDAKRDIEIREQINERIINSLSYIFEQCNASNFNCKLAEEKTNNLNKKSKISGMIHVLHNRLLKAIEDDNDFLIKHILNCFNELDYIEQSPRTIGLFTSGYTQSLHQLYYDTCDYGMINTYGYHFDGNTPSKKELEHSTHSMKKALNRMEEVDFDLFDELNSLITDIIIVNSPTMNAGSSLNTFGIIRMSQLRENQIWTRYLENLAHEAGHNHLNMLFFIDPIIINEDSGTYKSPLRREARPLSGIYHAMFVLARTMRILKKLTTHRDYDPILERVDTAYNNANNPASFEEKFNDCWSIILENAKLTELGKKLMNSTREMAFE
ncbi:hypothetical protein HGO23_05795 [Xenorhabdus budapestensis]|uniref:HEXXH motif domain-containing protein n=1 Tax=Xenorhabdus budapestensis TaxID=290110 RepID=A0ABX7VLP9_XENBU|nr:HEXXH motif-containing putative peptide modification protein [Xenorhabdus budapestensis]QTL40861.1 hypothetical protein HGO23_05795 [Xenorhabdus budapestensis]